MLKLINGKGGLVAYLQTTDGLEIEDRISRGDTKAKEVIEAANWPRLVNLISERVKFLAPIYIYPGKNEIESLAFGALRCLRGEEPVLHYS